MNIFSRLFFIVLIMQSLYIYSAHEKKKSHESSSLIQTFTTLLKNRKDLTEKEIEQQAMRYIQQNVPILSQRSIKKNNNALHIAIRYARCETVEYILLFRKAKSLMKQKNKDRKTPLALAEELASMSYDNETAVKRQNIFETLQKYNSAISQNSAMEKQEK